MANPLFCDRIGNRTKDGALRCCYADDQDAPACRDNIKSGAGQFEAARFDPITDCQNPEKIFYSKVEQEAYDATGVLPRLRFPICANTPNMARYLDQGMLEPSILEEVERYIPLNASEVSLKDITLAVTDCLTATCRNARNSTRCETQCAGVNLLVNSSTPDLHGLNRCMDLLCGGEYDVYDSLPYADADVIGIGVLSSYIMQCALIVVLFSGLAGFEFFKWTKSNPSGTTKASNKKDEVTYRSIVSSYVHDRPHDKETTQGRFVELLDQFHKAQCYFSVTIQIASLRYGIFRVNILNAFLLIPLATNGVLPVVFAYVLLLHCHKASLGTAVFTTICWLLSSLVYWILYSQLIPINDDIQNENKRLRAYHQFVYKLSALEACGGYSALAACPVNPLLGKDAIIHASHKIRVFTPIIWTFSTVCLLAVLGEKVLQLFGVRRKYGYPPSDDAQSDGDTATPTEFPDAEYRYHYSILDSPIVYGMVVLCFLAGTGMQLSLFSVALSLEMTDRSHWTFGQLVALTIWFPPIIAWFWNEMKMKIMPNVRRRVISFVTR